MESGLSIQSTYFFLSKIGCKIREVFFPKKPKDIWEKCDVVITTNKQIVNSKPVNKKVILIRKNDNYKLAKKCDLTYNSLTELCNDDDFFNVIKLKTENNILAKIKKIFNLNGKK